MQDMKTIWHIYDVVCLQFSGWYKSARGSLWSHKVL